MGIRISTKLLADILACRYKGYLKVTEKSGIKSDFQELQTTLRREYSARARKHLLQAIPADRVSQRPKSLAQALQENYQIITNAYAAVDDLSVRFDALMRLTGKPSSEYLPVLFVHREQVHRHDRLLLAFWGLVLTRLQCHQPRFGRIIYGDTFTPLKVRIDTLTSPVEQALSDIVAFSKGDGFPQLRLNDHCQVCEFSAHCHRLALEKDDLSLLRGLGEKEISKLNKKGIFTVTQLSYTFRPRRRRKKAEKRALKHDSSLQALAIRTDTIYIAHKPQIPAAASLIYLDIEGVPDRQFYYLIGLRIFDGASFSYLSLWADDRNAEQAIWESFLGTIENLGEFVVLHYGSYDSYALAQLQRRYGGNKALLERLFSSRANVLSMIYGHIYFPTYSNDLKSIASCLGFTWSHMQASGIQSLVWRHCWEVTRDEAYKRKLLTYNHEDCLALQTVMAVLSIICGSSQSPGLGLPKETVETQTLVRGWPNLYKRNKFFFPSLDRINSCSYYDYQRERIFVRTSSTVKRSVHRKTRERQLRVRINRTVECASPALCLCCGSDHIVRHGAVAKTVKDLKLFDGGVKRWNVKYTSHRYLCRKCNKTFLPKEYPSTSFGNTLRAWTVYHNIAHLRSQGSIVEDMRELFGYQYAGDIASRFKKDLASYYKPTYRQLLDRIRTGRLIHADETKVSVKGRTGYVWVFTNLEEVAYIYSETREGTMLTAVLEGFKGVLVSDFYAAYDSPNCDQQKCLIHLIRDINDDLFKNPFDEELKNLAADFTGLLVPMIETIDRYGLKKRHLNKHQPAASRFLQRVANRQFSSEIARGYQRRFGKYESKLFTFLKYDGVPWNNNNAENAVKRFVFLRRMIGGSSTEEGLKEYLILLSIRETLRRKNISFLQFLLARDSDIDAFLGGR